MSVTENPMAGLPRAFAIVFGFLLLLTLSAQSAVAEGNASALDPYPLRPANTSSPRDTLRSFSASADEVERAWRSRAPEEVIQRSARRAAETLDTSQLAERGKRAKVIESALLLKEILDRIELPEDGEIPGDEVLTEGEEVVTRWTIPNTRIAIARVEEGPRAGVFLFTAETVDRLEEFYEDAKHLPYKPGALVEKMERYAHRPGRMVPRSWAEAIPRWARTVVLGETLWQWMGFVITIIATYLVIGRLFRWGHGWDKRHHSARALMRFGTALSLVFSVLVLYASGVFLLDLMRFASDWRIVVSTVYWGVIFLATGWLIILLAERIGEAVCDVLRVKETSTDVQLISTLSRLFSLIFLILLVLYATDFFGMPLTPLVASIGIGGFAIALAVRPTMENIIGGLTLFVDKPVRIGDYCRYGADFGTVEDIGLRSTRVRLLDDTLASIPNSDFSQRELVNYARRRCILYETTLSLRYETTPEQLRYVITKLREMLIGHPEVSPKSLYVRFHSFGAYSLE